MSAKEISADTRKYAGWGGRGMIAEKTQWEQEKDKKSDIRGQRVWSRPAPKGLEKDRLPRGWTCTPVISKTRTKLKLTAEGRRCENVNVVVQRPFVEAGLIRLRILDPVLTDTENILQRVQTITDIKYQWNVLIPLFSPDTSYFHLWPTVHHAERHTQPRWYMPRAGSSKRWSRRYFNFIVRRNASTFLGWVFWSSGSLQCNSDKSSSEEIEENELH